MRLVSMREDEKPDLRGFDEALAKLHAQRNAESLQQFAENEYSPAPPRNADSQTVSVWAYDKSLKAECRIMTISELTLC